MKGETTRDLIVEAAGQLFYRRGYQHTSFADIAGELKISPGNFYYHFETKDEILDAVIHARLASTEALLRSWEAEDDRPVERIRNFIHIPLVNWNKHMRSGCPTGTLWAELLKLEHASRKHVKGLFTLFRTWLRRQFTLLGRASDADALAMHLLLRSQGIAMLASAFGDEQFIRREVEEMCQWLESVAGSAT